MRRLGAAVLLAAFAGFIGWAAVAPLSSAALASGMIAVENYRKTIQHLEGGIVKTIRVRDGDSVVKEQILLTLDDTKPSAELEVQRGQYYIEVAKEARLVAQRIGLKNVEYPQELLKITGDNRAQEAMRVQDQTFTVRMTAHENEIDVLQRQISQLRAKVKGLRGQKDSRDSMVQSYRSQLKDYHSLLKEGYIEKQKVRELDRNLAESEEKQSELISQIASTELQIAETELKILQLRKELQREVTKELGETQSRLFEIREKIRSLEDTVRRTVIKAPDAGMVISLAVHTLGAVIAPGAKILDIVPSGENLIVEAQVSPLDIDRVKIGQTAEVRLTAFKTRETPRIEGKLIHVSADRLVDETKQEKPPYYLARVAVSAEGLRDLHKKNLELVPGMPAEVLINTGERTLLQYLFRPLTDTFAKSFIED
jgi:epimerase transport system membrane fusion protein